MAIGRGENIGRAWVEVDYVGDKFLLPPKTARQIKDEMGKVGDLIEKEGEGHGERYGEALVDEAEGTIKKRRGRFRRAVADLYGGFKEGEVIIRDSDSGLLRFG